MGGSSQLSEKQLWYGFGCRGSLSPTSHRISQPQGALHSSSNVLFYFFAKSLYFLDCLFDGILQNLDSEEFSTWLFWHCHSLARHFEFLPGLLGYPSVISQGSNFHTSSSSHSPGWGSLWQGQMCTSATFCRDAPLQKAGFKWQSDHNFSLSYNIENLKLEGFTGNPTKAMVFPRMVQGILSIQAEYDIRSILEND